MGLDPLRGQYTVREFKREFETAKARLAPLGGIFIIGTHNFEAFVWKDDGGPKDRRMVRALKERSALE